MRACLRMWCWWPARALSVFPTGESGDRGTTPLRDIKVRRITAVLLCQHTHTHSEPSAPPFTVSDKFRCFSSAQQHIYTAWSSERKRALWEDFPPRLRPSWFSIINMLIFELRSDEWWRVGPLFSLQLAEICLVCDLICDVQCFMCLRMKACHPPASFGERSYLD